MGETVTTGTWWVDESRAEAFVNAWSDFAGWASSQAGAGVLRLGHDRDEPRRFVSFGSWESIDAVQVWKANPEMRRRMAEVLQHVEDFHAEELDTIAMATNGEATVPAIQSNE